MLDGFPLVCDSNQHWSCPCPGEYVNSLTISADPEKLWCGDDGFYALQDPAEKYAEFADLMERLGYAWERHEVKTADGWNLSMFRINHHVYDAWYYNSYQEDVVVVQHGYSDAQDMLCSATDSLHWALQLVDAGYDVWLPNNRGTRYSNVNDDNITVGELPFFEMGLLDQKAFINKIVEETGIEDMTYIGYELGASQMLFAMATDQEGLIHDNKIADHINRFIGIAPTFEIDTAGVEIDLSEISSIPVTLITSSDDTFYPAEDVEYLFDMIGYTDKNIWFMDGFSHDDFMGGK